MEFCGQSVSGGTPRCTLSKPRRAVEPPNRVPTRSPAYIPPLTDPCLPSPVGGLTEGYLEIFKSEFVCVSLLWWSYFLLRIVGHLPDFDLEEADVARNCHQEPAFASLWRITGAGCRQVFWRGNFGYAGLTGFGRTRRGMCFDDP